MSANNQVIITENPQGWYDVWINHCVDNEFEYNHADLLCSQPTLKESVTWVNQYCKENMVEYGYTIHLEDKE